MTFLRSGIIATAIGLSLLLQPQAALADKIVANCTGMLNLDIYTIDTELPTQEVDNIGLADVMIDEEAIELTGEFGSYTFDLKAGTLYHNGSDTSLYCTYSKKVD